MRGAAVRLLAGWLVFCFVLWVGTMAAGWLVSLGEALQ